MQNKDIGNMKDTEINGVIGVWDSVNHCSYFLYGGYVVKRDDDGDVSVLGVDPTIVPSEETDVFEWIDDTRPPITPALDADKIQRSLWMFVEDAKEHMNGFRDIFHHYKLAGPVYSDIKGSLMSAVNVEHAFSTGRFLNMNGLYETFFNKKGGE